VYGTYQRVTSMPLSSRSLLRYSSQALSKASRALEVAATVSVGWPLPFPTFAQAFWHFNWHLQHTITPHLRQIIKTLAMVGGTCTEGCNEYHC
jgi:hypothetical protein